VFSNVKKMILDMMHKLQQEAGEEAEHKGWCDTELGTNKQTRDTKTDNLDEVNSEIEELESTISTLDSDVGDLSASVKELHEAMEKATADRKAEQEKHETTIAEAKEAQHAVSKAMSVLKDFYAKAGKSTALTQISVADIGAPETFSEPYTGMQGASGGVVGLLEVILDDFHKLERETTVAESQAEAEFKKYMAEAKRDAAVKDRDAEHRTRQRQEAESSLVRRQQEKASTTEELEAAERYYEKLRPSCIDEGVSYEERVSKREEEINSLKEALTLLNNGVDFSGRSK
jgi:predicted  nucleic acid-binding Zn-ribbon protein